MRGPGRLAVACALPQRVAGQARRRRHFCGIACACVRERGVASCDGADMGRDSPIEASSSLVAATGTARGCASVAVALATRAESSRYTWVATPARGSRSLGGC